jgi:hypothetical protein
MPVVFSGWQTLSGNTLAVILVLLGGVFWILAYGFSIRQGFLDATYGLPWPNIALNITWELYFAFVCPAAGSHYCVHSGPSLWVIRVWFLLDCVIFFQLIRYGRRREENPFMHRYFYVVVGGFLVLAYLGQTTFIRFYKDLFGTEIAWLIDLVMSQMFIALFALRPGQRGLSLPAAWAMMLGNLATALSLLGTDFGDTSYGRFLFGATLVANVFYIALLRHARRQRSFGESIAILDS